MSNWNLVSSHYTLTQGLGPSQIFIEIVIYYLRITVVFEIVASFSWGCDSWKCSFTWHQQLFKHNIIISILMQDKNISILA